MAKIFLNQSSLANAEYLVKNKVFKNLTRVVATLAQDPVYTEELLYVCARESIPDAVAEFGIQVQQVGVTWIYRHADGSGTGYDSRDDAISAAAEAFSIMPCYTEAMERYGVSDWLADDFKRRGEMLLRDFLGTFNIWGRTVTGQYVFMDDIVCDIAESSLGGRGVA